jgi:hypothetical protein
MTETSSVFSTTRLSTLTTVVVAAAVVYKAVSRDYTAQTGGRRFGKELQGS